MQDTNHLKTYLSSFNYYFNIIGHNQLNRESKFMSIEEIVLSQRNYFLTYATYDANAELVIC